MIYKTLFRAWYSVRKHVVESNNFKLMCQVRVRSLCPYMSSSSNSISFTETAMGVSKSTQDQSGLEYAMAVMKMCDILHLRHTKIWMRPDMLFNWTQHSKNQSKLLDVIHGLTKKVRIQKDRTP